MSWVVYQDRVTTACMMHLSSHFLFCSALFYLIFPVLETSRHSMLWCAKVWPKLFALSYMCIMYLNRCMTYIIKLMRILSVLRRAVSLADNLIPSTYLPGLTYCGFGPNRCLNKRETFMMYLWLNNSKCHSNIIINVSSQIWTYRRW